MTDAVAALAAFVHAGRRRGMKTDQSRLAVCVDALAHVDRSKLDDVYWAMRATLCATRADVDVFDALFDEWFRPVRAEAVREATVTGSVATYADARTGFAPEHSPASAHEGVDVAASGIEVLRSRDVAELTPEEKERLEGILARIRPRPAIRRQRRSRAHRRGAVDLDRTVAQMLRNGGELTAVRHRRRRPRRRRLVLVIDVSGSMDPYSELLLRFAHAAVRSAPRDVEVFAIGTRLTRITPELTTPDAGLARAAAHRSTADRGAGTRLTEGMRLILEGPHRRVIRGAIVVIATDAGEPGRAEALGRHLDRVGRAAHALIWANPLADMPTGAVRPPAARILSEIANVTVRGNSVADLQNLADLVSGL